MKNRIDKIEEINNPYLILSMPEECAKYIRWFD